MSDTTTRNPFSAAQEHTFITMDVKTCDICERQGSDAFYKLLVLYNDQWKIASTVCPDCMQRLGFKPTVTIPMDEYERLRDASELLHIQKMNTTSNKD